MASFWVNGVVAQWDKQPYIQLSNENGMIVQFSMAEARNVAHDILVMCSRTEADAMILKFFDRSEFPESAGVAIMDRFRDYRAELDDQKIEKTRD
jgi:hypothetical protein